MLLTPLLLHLPLAAAPLQEGYRTPPREVVELLTADPTPSVSFSPDGDWMLLVERDALPPVEVVGRPLLRLAGVRLDPAANGPFRASFSKGLRLRRADAETEVRVPLAEGAQLADVSWSHDSRRFAYQLVGDGGTELWVCDVTSPTAPVRLTERLNATLTGPSWMPNGRELVFCEVPEDRGPAPAPPTRPAGPNARETRGSTSPLRTYQDLLSSQHDEATFEHYAEAQVVVAGARGRRTLGVRGLHMGLEPSPTGEQLLVWTLKRPFSYVMPYYRFPHAIEVWDAATGGVDRIVAEVPLGEGIPIDGVRTGPRMVGWTPTGLLAWAEALDGGDPKREAEHRDRWIVADPKSDVQEELTKVEHRARGLTWFGDEQRVVVSEYDRDRRWTRATLVDRNRPDAAGRVLEDRSVRDRYGDPGSLVTEPLESGFPVVLTRDGRVWRTGSGASPDGLLPFLDEQDLATLETRRLWRCEPGTYEAVVHVETSGTAPRFVTRKESTTTPPNYVLRQGDSAVALTSFPDPTPQIRGIVKELVTFERPDGVPLSATLYLPADREEGERLPLFVWAYPIEFNDARTAGQVTASPSRFTRITGSSHLALVTQGYAVLDGATMPIIGDPETMNDTFVEQIVSAAQAAIDYAVERGVADRERVAVGGHSYGAFMTANLLAHCDLFKAGVARSGAYNRTLTPFGFQSERRTIWEAPEAYFKVSPFFVADAIDEPLLLIHGEVDDNSGTYPMQSERLFAAIQGNGGTARLVMLPHESHGYRAEESVLHVQAETIDWLDEHVKGAAAVEAGYRDEER